MPKIFKISLLQKSGLLTKLQSDTIFGHFCWRLREISGEQKLVDFLNLYEQGNPVFTLSDSFFESNENIFLPSILIPIQPKVSAKTKVERINEFIEYKDLKKKKFLNLQQFNLALNGKVSELDSLVKYDKMEQPKYFESLRTSVEINRSTFTSKEGQLFSFAPSYIKKSKFENKENETLVIVFIKIINEEVYNSYQCENILKEVFNTGFGKKKSSGYGHFETKDFVEFDNQFKEPDNSNGFVTLSNYLPSTSDKIKDAYYEMNIKYGKFGEERATGKNPFKKPIVMLQPGSCFMTDEKKDFYGRCTNPGEISKEYPDAVQNGYCFSLRIKINN